MESVNGHFNLENLSMALSDILHNKGYDHIFTLCDTNTSRFCLPKLLIERTENIVIPAGEDYKTLNILQKIWQTLISRGASRHSLLINVGGGMICDLGGFAAASFMRGIDYVNVPTTLLAMVDAAIGGKTAVNFCGLKNELGAFYMPVVTLVCSRFLSTLPKEYLLAGIAEMLKHSLLWDVEMWAEIVSGILLDRCDLQFWQESVLKSAKVKKYFVDVDPYESGVRKALNLGHTFGHAFEELSLKKDASKSLSHGFAVAYGLVCALYLSCIKLSFPQDKMRQTISFIFENYSRPLLSCDDYDELLMFMHRDKKNNASRINLVLLDEIGKYSVDCSVTDEEIKEAFDFLREG